MPPKAQYDAADASARGSNITSFRVFSRVRPFIPSELEAHVSGDLCSVVEVTGRRTVLLDPKEGFAPKSQFEFDSSLWSIPDGYKMKHTYDSTAEERPFASQKRVFELVAADAAQDAFAGINTAVLSYGQTGSGKTYTMMGQYDPKNAGGADSAEGIIPRVCHDVFKVVEERRAAQDALGDAVSSEDRITYNIELTFVEVYMEKVRDLLDPNARRRNTHVGNSDEGRLKEAKIRLDPNSGPFIEDVTKYAVEDWAKCCKLLEHGSAQRRTCANVVHEQSSRSHAVFALTIIQTQTTPGKDKYSEPIIRTKTGRINLVDLAGSERGGMTDYVKESAKINVSLLALRRVIDTLLERQQIVFEQMRDEIEAGQMGMPPPERALPAVPFRESVLTWLLSDSLGGNARTTLIAALSPHEKNFTDTLSTLQWSSKARGLVGVVKVNDAQSSVQTGMTNKKSEIANNINSRQQNVSALRDELTNKKDMISDLDMLNKSLMRSTIDAKTDAERRRILQATLIIHRYIIQWRNRKKMKVLNADLKVHLDYGTGKDAETAALASAVLLAQAKAASQNAKMDAAAKDAKPLKQKYDKYDAAEEVFVVREAESQKTRAEGDEALKIEADKYADEVVAAKDSLETATAKLDKAKGTYETLKEDFDMMTKEVEEFTPEVSEAMAAETVKLVDENKKFEDTVVAPLRAKKADLEKQKKDLQDKIAAKKK